MSGLFGVAILVFILANHSRGRSGVVTQTRVDVPLRSVIRPLGAMAILVLGLVSLVGWREWLRYGLSDDLPSWSTASIFVLLAIVFPRPFVRGVLAPLGLVRVAWALERICSVSSDVHERDAAGLLAAACVTAARYSAARARFVQTRLDAAWELATEGAAAAALVAAARGDLAEARSLFRLLRDHRFASPATARMSRDWLAVDAAARGDWPAITRMTGADIGRLGALFVEIATRPKEPRRADDLRLWWRWLLAPRRIATFAFVRRASRAPITRDPTPPIPSDGLSAHRALLALAPERVRRVDVQRAISAIDTMATSPSFLAGLGRRALALSIDTDVGLSRDAFVRALEQDVVAVLAQTDLSLRKLEPGPTLDRVLDALRRDRREQLELLVRDVGERTASRRALLQREEWRAWGEIHAALTRAGRNANATEHAVLHQIVFSPVTNWAVWLANVRGMRSLAAHIFTVLRDHAEEARDASATALLTRNIAGCTPVRLPRRDALPGAVLGDSAGLQRAQNRYLTLLGLLVVVALAVASVANGQAGPAFAASFFALLGVALIVPIFLLPVEASVTPDGVWMQTRHGAWYAAVEDVAVRGGPHGMLLVLRRRPSWLRGFAVAFSSAPAATRTALDALAARQTGSRQT